jgi:hypothetical protein
MCYFGGALNLASSAFGAANSPRYMEGWQSSTGSRVLRLDQGRPEDT